MQHLLRQVNRQLVYKIIDLNQTGFSVKWLLSRFKVYPNAYYNYLKQRKNTFYENKKLVLNNIKEVYHSENGKMGYRMRKLLLE